MVQVEGSSPRGDAYDFFSNDFYFTFMLCLMDFTDTVIQRYIKCFDKPLEFIFLRFVFMK